jgi:PhzF family phenazine biosynthesis protein
MSQNLPSFGSRLDPTKVAECLGSSPEALMNDNGIPIQIASTGLNKIFVPLRSLEHLRKIKPDFNAIENFSRANNTIGMYCYSLETIGNATAHCRNFAPVVGIMEDSATGTSAAALSCVLHRFGMFSGETSLALSYEQGYSIGQPAELLVFLQCHEKNISSVRVAGRAGIRENIQLK